MKAHTSRGFTLIEMLTVMAVIAILASLVIAVAGYAQSTAAKERAKGEIAALSTACENYKADNGGYPRAKKTDELDPRKFGNPATGDSGKKYQDASLRLYVALSGDSKPDEDHPDGRPEPEQKAYYEFKPEVLDFKKAPDGKIKEINYLKDPWGNSYGYSTAAANAEEEYRSDLRKNPQATRAATAPGYNPTFDLWSTGGSTRNAVDGNEQVDVKKWVKNW